MKFNLFAIACLLFLFAACADDSKDIVGCTDPTADNYNPNATVSDNNCSYSVNSFFNTYTAKTACSSKEENTNKTHTLTISKSDNDNFDVVLNNLLGDNNKLYGNLIANNEIEVKEQFSFGVSYRANIKIVDAVLEGIVVASPDRDCNFTATVK